MGIEIEASSNEAARGPSDVADIATAASRVRVLVVPTNEELEIATQSLEAVG
ncbi:MAG TPA: hypothetical protein PLQ14_12900 [Actinomycetota bacterium]|nr:hypothetical protein [Actinomycetota bacterium]